MKTGSLLIGLSIAVSLHGQQDLRFQHFNINDGLPQNSVTCINNDRFGFLWIGTFDGLCRYDGYEFKTYRSEPGNPRSIKSNSIYTIYRDLDETLWIGTLGGGLCSYDPGMDGFRYYELGLSKNNVRSIRQDADSSLWIGTNSGLVNFDPVSGKKRIYSYESGNPFTPGDNAITALEIDSLGNIWIGTQRGGLNMFERSTEKFLKFNTIKAGNKSLSLEEVTQLEFSDQKRLLIGTKNLGLLEFNTVTLEFKVLIDDRNKPQFREELNFTTVDAIFPENDSIYWVGMLGGGLLKFNMHQGTFVPSLQDEEIPFSLSRNAVSSIFVDQPGNLWVGTIDGGLNFSNHHRKDYSFFIHQPNDPGSLSRSSVLSVLEDSKQNIWVGTDEGGLNVKAPWSNGFRRLPSGSDDRNSTIHHVITSLCEDHHGNILIGTPSNGLSVYHPASDQFTHYTTGNSGLKNNWIFTITEDTRGKLWLGTNGGGLIQFDMESGSSEQYLFNIDEITSISNDYVTCVLESGDSGLWVGTWDGLNRFDRERKIFRRYFYGAGNPFSLPNNGITCLFIDSRKNFWVGTYSGLGLYSPEKDGFITFTEREGLPNNVVAAIEEDNQGYLWISTFKGLSKLDITDTSFTNFNLGEGVYGNQFTIRSSTKTTGGELYFGNINGLYRIQPDRLQVDSSVARVILTDFKLFNKSVVIDSISPLTSSIMQTEVLELRHFQHSFSIDFVSINFNVSSQCNYRYILEGFDPDWVNDPPNRTAVYTNVPPGEYIFRVMASNSDGIWSDQSTNLSIRIIPAFYQRVGFRILLLLFLVLVSASIPLIRYRSIKRQRNHLEKVVRERTKEIVKQKEEIEIQANSIKRAHQDIIHKNIELSFQKDEIESQSKHIEEMNRLLQMKADNLVLHLHEISEKRVMQKNVSFEEFREIYPDDAACYEFLRELRSARPFECHKCHSTEFYPSEEHLFRRCKSCGYREPLTYNTIFYRIKFPILKAFYILYLVSTGRELTIDDLSGVVNLRRETCWSFRNRVMEVMNTRKRFRNPKEGWKELIMIPKQMRTGKE
ncbi:MAG: two-component regulator propeller domain-containing protein [Bacteroidales bacterium]